METKKAETALSAYENRYKRKLNMLEPGTKMLKWAGVLLLAGGLLLLLRRRIAAYCAMGLSGVLFAVLMILLAIEAHQDKVLNDIALRENRENDPLNQ